MDSVRGDLGADHQDRGHQAAICEGQAKAKLKKRPQLTESVKLSTLFTLFYSSGPIICSLGFLHYFSSPCKLVDC